MTEQELAAVRKCAEWVEWTIPPRTEPTFCVLWEACRAKLEAERQTLDARHTRWWVDYGTDYLMHATPLENLKAVAEVLP